MKKLTYVYLVLFSSTCLTILALFLYNPKNDHIGAISLDGDPTWYMNFRRTTSTQALDRDILYHRIGRSIANAKAADIIIIGHSMALFGIDWRLIVQFEKKYNIKIFNMSSGGDTSGEFLLRVAKKHNLNPAIWIINADDHERSFFSEYLSTITKGESGEIVTYNRWQAYKNTVSKNIKWNTELILRHIIPKEIINLLYPDNPIYNYRSNINGNWNNDSWPGYIGQNDFIHNSREPNCHATNDEYIMADKFIKRLNPKKVILTLIPHQNSCRTRVQEIAEHIHVPFISIGWQKISSFDHGGHLDQRGANKFTKELLMQLEKSSAFKELIKQSKPRLLLEK